MKKVYFALLSLLVAVFTISACSPGSSDGGGSSPATYTLDIEPGTRNLSKNQTYNLTAVVKDASGNPLNVPVSWTVSDSTFGKFDGGVEVLPSSKTATFTTTSKTGTFKITIDCEGITKEFGFSVEVDVNSIEIFASTNSVANSGMVQLSAKVYDSSSNDITESVKDGITWSVDQLGSLSTTSGKEVTFTASASGSGDAKITATIAEKSATKIIGVVESKDIYVILKNGAFPYTTDGGPYGFYPDGWATGESDKVELVNDSSFGYEVLHFKWGEHTTTPDNPSLIFYLRRGDWGKEDFTPYNLKKLKFKIKGNIGNSNRLYVGGIKPDRAYRYSQTKSEENIKSVWGDGGAGTTWYEYRVRPDESWTDVSIDVNTDNCVGSFVQFEIWCDTLIEGNIKSGEIYLDDIRFEKQ